MTHAPQVASKRRQSIIALGLLLVAGTAMVYWPIISHGFSNYDDRQYIVENPHVASGLTWSGIVWSFQCGYASNWHPLTWLSHMMDCSLYGLNPSGHHFTNLAFHVLNTLLLFRLCQQLTGSVWRSFLVAAFFGWHPLHVESVAWASERKDVLSTFFWILTMMAYARYVEEARSDSSRAGVQGPKTQVFYGLSLALFVAGLMSKPMLVTLPFVLLLLDFWPLGRLPWAGFGADNVLRPGRGFGSIDPPPGNRWNCAMRLIREKLPFFVLTLLVSGLTFRAQQTGGALWSSLGAPVSLRVANALTGYVSYLGKTVWPAGLAVVYPYPVPNSMVPAIAAAAFLATMTFLFVWRAGRRPYFIVGWLWFLGTLVPVIGLVQVGPQAMADRYLYVPGMGLFILIAWGLADLAGSAPWKQNVAAGVAAVALAGCLAGTSVQVRYWQDDERLFRRALEVTTNNYIACNILGQALEVGNQKDLAFDLYAEAVRIEPRYPLSQYNLGTALMDRGRLDEAISHFATALKNDPQFAEPHNNWGKALLDQGKRDEAAAHFGKAVELQPDNAEMRYNLGTLCLMQSRITEAITQLTVALRLKPDYAAAHKNLAFALMQQGRVAEGITHFAEVVRLDGDDPLARIDLGLALLEDNRPAEAEMQFSGALRRKPDDAGFHYHLATALLRQRKSKAAILQYREALRLQPEYSDALNGLAWVLASDPNPELRSGLEAVQLAERACQSSRHTQGAFEITLAAALAETGQFAAAVATANKARDLALAAGQRQVVARAEELAGLFESRRTVAEALK
jgi:protein O-mannosyl-transferase